MPRRMPPTRNEIFAEGSDWVAASVCVSINLLLLNLFCLAEKTVVLSSEFPRKSIGSLFTDFHSIIRANLWHASSP